MELKAKATREALGEKPCVNAYLRWALIASEEVAGKQGLNIVMREAGLERFIDNYPPEDFTGSAGASLRDYALLSTGLLKFFGRAGRGGLLRIGKRSTRLAIDKQMEMMGIGAMLAAARLLPMGMKQKAGLDANISAFKKVYKDVSGIDWRAHVEDRGDKWAYIVEDCALCLDHEADAPICAVFTGTLGESMLWFLEKEFDVQEVQCRAQGANACVWEISKKPKE
jgi:predicted hydrocarbon binding protein